MTFVGDLSLPMTAIKNVKKTEFQRIFREHSEILKNKIDNVLEKKYDGKRIYVYLSEIYCKSEDLKSYSRKNVIDFTLELLRNCGWEVEFDENCKYFKIE